jgi:hypothetical protein
MMSRLSAIILLALVAGLAACGSPSAQPHPSATPPSTAVPTVTSTPVRVTPSIPASHVEALVTRMQSAYAASDWEAIRRTFANPSIARSLLIEMQNWKLEDVRRLTARLVYRTTLKDGTAIGTVEFQADPRAIPSYTTYRFKNVNGQSQITGTAAGIHGRSYKNANWRTTRSAHFIVHYGPFESSQTVRQVLTDLEFERSQFIKKFGVTVAPLTAYYWYPQQHMMAPMTQGACGTTPEFVGCADPYTTPPSIQTSEWPSYHEPIHIYELSIEPPATPNAKTVYVAPLFIGEGTAVALEDREVDPQLSDYCSDLEYIPLDACAREAVPGVDPLSLLSDRGFAKAKAGDAYALGGSFVKYLILRYGYHRFGRFYYVLAAQPKDRQRDYDVAAQRVYHQPIAALLAAWKSELCSIGC